MLKRLAILLAPEGAAPAAPPAAPAADAPPPAAPAAPAATPAKPAPEKSIDPKQLAGFASDFLGKQFTGSTESSVPGDPLAPSGPAPKAGAAAAPAAPAAPAKPKKAPVKPAPPKVEPKAEPAPSLTAEQIAQAAAKGVAEAIKPSSPAAAPKTELSPAEERRYATLQHMERMYPEKYTGLADKYKVSLIELQRYAEKWESEHPGETFDEEAEEHSAFFSKHPVDWEDDDYTEAVADIRATAKMQEQQKESEKRMSKLERGERLRQAAPEIGEHQTAGASVFWGNTTPELAKVIKDDGTVDTALLLEQQKKDPIGYTLRVNAANQLNHEVAELYKVMNGLEDFNAKNPAHVAIGQFAADMERDLVLRPDEQQRDAQGRKFAPAKDYWKMPKERREEYYWTFSPAELAALRAHSLAGQTENLVKAEHKRQREYALAMGWKPPEGSEIVAPAAGEAGSGEAEPADGKPRSPSAGGESRLHAKSGGGAKGAEDFLSSFGKKQLGQS